MATTPQKKVPTREEIAKAVESAVLTPERVAKQDVHVRVSKRLGCDIRAAQVPIDIYYNRRIIGHGEYTASQKIYRDFFISGQAPGMTINLDPTRAGDRNFTEEQLNARDRWRAAMKAIKGNIGQLMVLNVCCYGYWLKDIPYMHYKTPSECMSRFHEALDDLIEHYGLTRDSE